jgi:hypothetical protein
MSDFDEVDDEEQQRGLENVLKRYQQRETGSASAADKKQKISKLNITKTHTAKITKLHTQKKERDNTIEVSEDDDDDDYYSESDEEEYIPPPKKKSATLKGKEKADKLQVLLMMEQWHV